MSALELLRVATTAAEAAAAYLRVANRPDAANWTLKESRDFVTNVDRHAEAIIREVLAVATPAARIVGEEMTPESTVGSGLVWIVDPLDGTTNFLHGVPIFAVSIAAAENGVLQAGVVLDVSAQSCYSAAKGGGAWLGTERLQVSSIDDPGLALIGTGFPFKDLSSLDEYQRQFATIAAATSGIRRPGAASIDLAWVAAGKFDGFWEQRLAPWDIAAGALLVREAGGIITDAAGHSDILRHTSVVAGSPAMHPWLLHTLSAQLPPSTGVHR